MFMDSIQMVRVTVPTITSQGWEATRRPCIRNRRVSMVQQSCQMTQVEQGKLGEADCTPLPGQGCPEQRGKQKHSQCDHRKHNHNGDFFPKGITYILFTEFFHFKLLYTSTEVQRERLQFYIPSFIWQLYSSEALQSKNFRTKHTIILSNVMPNSFFKPSNDL